MKLKVNGEDREVKERTTVLDLLNQLQLPSSGVAVAVNGRVISRSHHSEHVLYADDAIELIRAVGGG